MAGDRRRVVAGFGFGLYQCGWAATADLVNYELKRRTGEWESAFVGAAGPLHQAIVTSSHEEAVALRERLNNSSAAEVRGIVERRGSAPVTIEVLQQLLDVAWRVFELTGKRPSELGQVVWPILDADPDELEELVGQLRERAREIQAPEWPSFSGFPFEAVVFDLDQTLVDSSMLGTPSARYAWAERGTTDDRVRTFEVAGCVRPHELPAMLAERNVPVGIVTRAPKRYVERVLAMFDIHADHVRVAAGDKHAALRACARHLGVRPEDVVVMGDDASDFGAGDEVGAWTLGALWTPDPWPDRRYPDIACRKPELLLRVVDWTRLGLLAEQDAGVEPVTHAGSWITHSGASRTFSLGRYFKSGNARHEDDLSRTILAGKARSDPDPVIEQALEFFAEHVRERAGIDVVTSVPSENGRVDRFGSYRPIAAEAFDAEDEQLLETAKTVTGYKWKRWEDRAAANKGRFRADPKAAGLHVLVIDDVRTSGSTFAACEAALLEAGAAEVSSLAFAATQD
jgi:phosphoglycolate phosphatase-like HAD superfamily hydrolase